MRRFAATLVVLCFAPAIPLPAQEFRAAWVDIFHAGMSSQSEVDTLVSTLASARYNAVIVQVLGYMDYNGTSSHGAQWQSSLVPWSPRVKANFDPLAYLCTQAHAAGIEVHAWIGGSGGAMYRVSLTFPPNGNSTLIAHPEWFIAPVANSEGGTPLPVDGYYSLDMGSPDVQEYIVSIVRELVNNYPIDGINWDDELNGAGYTAGFGYPAYSQASYPRSGLARFRINNGYADTYTPSNGDTAWSNYRRRFKNELMARVQAEIQSIKSNPRQPLRHTSATMAYGSPPGSCTFTSEEAYTYFSDWPAMLQNGWLDAVIPQAYGTSAFNSWADRITSCWIAVRPVFMGMSFSGTDSATIASEISYLRGKGLKGYATYSYFTAPSDWWAYAAANVNTSVVTTPDMPWRNPATAKEGIMWGRVKDFNTGQYVDDATVTVVGKSSVKTDGNGCYVVTLIPATAAGTVRSTTASKSGMTPQTIANAKVLAGDVVRYDFTLNAPAPVVVLNTPTNNASYSYPATIAMTATVTTNGNSIDYVGFFNGGTLLAYVTNSPYAYSWTDAPIGESAVWARVVYNGASYVNSASSNITVTNRQPAIGLMEPLNNSRYSLPTNINLRATVVSFNNVIDYVGFYAWGTNLIANVATAPYVYSWSNPSPGSYSLTARATYNGGATVDSLARFVTVTNELAPGIVTQPQSCIRGPGGSATFQVTATNATAYQWRLGGVDIAGETSTALNLINIQAADFGTYTVLVSGNGSSVLSSPAQLVLAAQPTVSSPSLDVSGFSLTFTTEAGPVYTVEHKDDLEASGWQLLTNVTGTGVPITVTDEAATNASRYYRIQVQ